MRIHIRGKETSLSKKEIRCATKFFAAHLMSFRQTKNIIVNIALKKNLINKGECEVNDIHNPYEFVIYISNKMSKKLQLHTLAHELVHVKQYVKRELIDHSSLRLINYSTWKNKKYNLQKLNYFDQPWEIDAYGREIGLYVRYKDYLKKTKKKFK